MLHRNLSKCLVILSTQSMATVCFTAQRNVAVFLYIISQESVIYVAKEGWSKEMDIDYFKEIQYPYLGLVERIG